MIEKTIHKIALYAIAFISILLTLSSCIDEEIIDHSDNGRITFVLAEKKPSDKGEWKEPSSQKEMQHAPQKTILEIGGKQIDMQFTCEENSIAYNQEPVTRGAAFDNDTHCITHIYATAISENGNGGNIYFEDEKISINNDKGNSTHFWSISKLSFFAYASSRENVTIAPLFTRENKECKGTFEYTLPAAATGGTKKDATNQPDVVFAIAPDKSHETSPNVDLVFHHALSAITFKSGKMPANVFLNSITIEGVYSSGTCNMNVVDTNDIHFEWTYNNGQLQNASYTEVIGESAIQGELMGDEDAVFMMLPQNMGTATKLILSFKIEGNDFTLEKNFNEIITSWEADKNYIFTIGLPSDIEVEVNDQVSIDKTIKSNLSITNTGYVDIYVRAMLFGEWVSGTSDDLVVVAPWNKDTDGKFTNFNTSDWLYSEKDGFYYYKYPLVVGAEANDLFDSYTLNTTPPTVDAELQLSIASQAVALDNIEVVWGYAVTVNQSTQELQLAQ